MRRACVSLLRGDVLLLRGWPLAGRRRQGQTTHEHRPRRHGGASGRLDPSRPSGVSVVVTVGAFRSEWRGTMDVDWELVEAGPAGADHVVLLLLGGLTCARSYEELMAQPELAGGRLVAALLPGHVGT